MNRSQIMDKIVCDITQEMTDHLLSGMDRMCMEVVLGEAVVQVYVHEVPAACEITDVQVIVMHDDERHKSPLLEKAIIDAMPDWYDMKHNMEGDGWLIA